MGAMWLAVKTFFYKFFIVFMAVISFGIVPRGTKDPVDSQSVRVMSFNIRYAEFAQRIGMVPRLIAEYQPDSVGVQECTYDWYLTMETLLPDYTFVGIGRDTGDISEDCGEMSAVLFRKDKYNLVDSGSFWLSETPDEISFGWDAVCRRICTWVILENKETGEKYAHINAHFDHEGDIAREKSAKMISDKAMNYDIPAVVTGDFNFSKGSEFYNILIDSGLRDTQDAAADTMSGRTYNGYENRDENGLPIDFILVNSKIASVGKYRIVRDKYWNSFVSDHYPIYADIVIG